MYFSWRTQIYQYNNKKKTSRNLKILSKTQLKKHISIQYFLILFLSKFGHVSLNFNVTKGKKEKLELGSSFFAKPLQDNEEMIR